MQTVHTAECSYVPILKGQSTIGAQRDLDTECLLRDMLAVIIASVALAAMVYKHVGFATAWPKNHNKDKHNKKHTHGMGCWGV